jgi:hypothetical protein
MANLLQEVKDSIKNPGALFCSGVGKRAFYKSVSNFLLTPKRARRKALQKQLPPVKSSLRLSPDDGFKILSKEFNFKQLEPLLRRAEAIKSDPANSVPKGSKAHLNHLVRPEDLVKYPEFMDFALNPELLSVAADYIGELPLLGGVYFWHAHPVEQDWNTSQLYHTDYDDIRQFKVFVFVNDIDEQSGPFTCIPARITDRLSNKLQYNRQGYIQDKDIRPLLTHNDETIFTGPAGTIAFVDTSRAFHFGSRVSTKDRYMIVFQYLSVTNFIYNPFVRFKPYPYAHLTRDSHDAVAKAVLTGE